jgi:hypothetical protein
MSPSYLVLEVKGPDKDQSETKKAALTSRLRHQIIKEGLERDGTA